MKDLQNLAEISIRPEGKETGSLGNYVIEPLTQGYGHTLGSSLRRVLLASLPGAAITEVKIDGVRHQFSTIEGVREDVVQIILNLKQVKLKIEDKEEATLRLVVQKAGEVKAGDFEVPAGVTIINPDLYLASLAGKSPKLKMEAKVAVGRGYQIADEASASGIGVIPVDAIFTPIERVNYRVEPIRVGRYANYDRLVLEVATDGTMTSLEAIKQAAKILVSYFGMFSTPRPKVTKAVDASKASALNQAKLTRMPIEELGLPTRVANSLHRGGIETVEDLTSRTPQEISETPNVGEKSVEMIAELLTKQGLKFKEG